MWAGIVGDFLVGLHVLPLRLKDQHYRDFLLHDLPNLLEDVPLAIRARMWYVCDGVPTYFSRAVRDVLNNTYNERRLGRGGPTARSPRSSDLNVLDFYQWGHLKSLCMQLLLITKRHFTIALWMPVRQPANTPAFLNECGGP
jgi:hypothetical protein